ncbi:dienelactone hydrolase family protein [Rhizobium sp. KVB221]|uniref:Dienelactone hydrolase family protein n=1 Tax=Rhizobium setariae TaxID=2801340 RepID=A0A936YJZ0_9HYPH|nr:dienelactone hydrolase family protein [Rhizobium setariae]MBL0371593.1 dienelactone hydrolase family protein [Rhizobium setariae]
MDQPSITQAMIDAYDEYTHLTLDRRAFMSKLQMLAGSGAAAAAIAPLLAANNARAAIVPADDSRLETGDVTYRGAPGDIKAYMVMPKEAAGKLPAVIVIHENRGLNDHIRDVTRRVALEGYVALAPDLLSPSGGTPKDEDKARQAISELSDDITRTNLLAAHEFLKTYPKSNGKVGAVGFCWGGGWVNKLAVADPDLRAGVAYYGMQVPAADVPKIKASLVLHYAGLDERINKGIAAYKAALEANKKDFEVFIYEGVNHAFNNDTSAARYDKKAADLAWKRTIDFFKHALS